MLIKVRVPLNKLTGDKTEFECPGNTVEELLANMDIRYPEIKECIWDVEGRIKHPFSLFLNGRNVKFLKKEAISLKYGDEILLMQLIPGE